MAVVPRYLSRDELLDLHDGMMSRYGGMPGVRDEGIVDSCRAQPQAHVLDVERFPTLIEKTAAYCFFIVRNHPFFDGNKRTGFLAALHFLRINGVQPWFDEDQAYNVTMGVAKGELGLDDVATMIGSAVARGEPPSRHGESNG